jgi:hypothetical protein
MAKFDSIAAVAPISMEVCGCYYCKRKHLDDLALFRASGMDYQAFYCEVEGRPYVLVKESYHGEIHFTHNGVRPTRIAELKKVAVR